jgi:hypothetical protein
MSISFAKFAANETNIKFSTGLVLGFMVQFNDPQFGTPSEILYAATPDGVFYESAPIARPNAHFDVAGRKWEKVDFIPDHAEFIGHYRLNVAHQ